MEVDEPESTMSSEDYFRTQVRKLYPAVDESITPLPRLWMTHKDLAAKLIVQQSTKVEYKGPGSKGYKDAASARANTEIPSTCGIYYFEITVISKGRDGYIGVGLVGNGDENGTSVTQGASAGFNRLPGWDPNSYGYHGDDGNAFSNTAHGTKYGPKYSSGDIVGCCINLVEKNIFFTKNGNNLGVVFDKVPDKPMFPTVGLQTPGELVEANFGQKPFKFDFEGYLNEFRRNTMVEVVNFPVDDQDGLFQLRMQALVANFLHHQGFIKAATAFESAVKRNSDPEPEVTRKVRTGIITCILRGQLTEAIARLSTDFPNLLEQNHELLFQLRYQQLIEIIGGTEHEMKNYSSSEKTFGGLPNGAIEDFISKGRELREIVVSHSVEFSHDDTHSKLEQIKRISTLLIDSDPRTGPNAPLFNKARREQVVTTVSAAIRESQNLSKRPDLALLVNHVRQLHDTMLNRDIPQAAFTQPDNFLSD